MIKFMFVLMLLKLACEQLTLIQSDIITIDIQKEDYKKKIKSV